MSHNSPLRRRDGEAPSGGHELVNIEVDCLLQALRLRWGIDFRRHDRTRLVRRLLQLVDEGGWSSVSDLVGPALRDRALVGRLLDHLTVGVTEMFRDPEFFRVLREDVLPGLVHAPVLHVWHAGCATGEEVYSLAIVLAEEGLLERTRIYATDINPQAIAVARQGIYPVDRFPHYTRNYQQAGGRRSFGDYYAARYGSAVLDRALRERIVFSEHNLAVDGCLGDMDVVVCRNVLIYLSRRVERRALRLFARSLSQGGFLCLGSHETVAGTRGARAFEAVHPSVRVFRRREEAPVACGARGQKGESP